MQAREIMTREVVTVAPETSIEELAGVLTEKRISGAPVVDDTGGLVGIVTENDLIRRDARLHIPTVLRIFDAVILLEKPGHLRDELKRMAAAKVEEIMVRDVVTVSPETEVGEIATIMAEKGAHLLPVMDDGRLVGIIGKIDLVRSLTGAPGGS